MNVEDKVALITGAAEGLGKAFAEELLKKNARGIAIVDVQRSKGEATAKKFQETYGKDKAVYIYCDVTDAEKLKSAFILTKLTYDRIDIVVNNAGVGDEKKWEMMLKINLTAVIQGTFLAQEHMSHVNGGQGGVIINVASMAGLLHAPYAPVYTATKYGVVGLTRCLGLYDDELVSNRIRINALCPAFTDTAIINKSTMNASKARVQEIRNHLDLLPVALVAKAFMRLVEENLHGQIMRVTLEKGIDFQYYKPIPKL
ncbi:15-hydroxyprostaglandin dehydrogenase [NAD(+)]-like [Antedon mediterranea]|uniref:15-hydroxyprostaglandin dehydrogenase [NAD(+)]-like n=1 Tax=Antedon mediterranea TaxID=105859 RepID=UPI003AF83ACA